MIELEIKKTKDFDILGIWSFNKNALTIGGIDSQLSDIKINNEDFKKEVIEISTSKKNLTMTTFDKNIKIYINGKKTIGGAFLKINDQIQLGHTLAIIKNFSYSKHSLGSALTENLQEILRGNHPAKNIIKKLEQYLRK